MATVGHARTKTSRRSDRRTDLTVVPDVLPAARLRAISLSTSDMREILDVQQVQIEELAVAFEVSGGDTNPDMAVAIVRLLASVRALRLHVQDAQCFAEQLAEPEVSP